jgi:DNA-damage-inducible protein J
MANTTNFSVRMDSEVKYQCEELFGELGMNLTTAINVFLRQSLRVGGLPFEVKVDRPNKETIAAMREAERLAHDPNAKRYTDLDELFGE